VLSGPIEERHTVTELDRPMLGGNDDPAAIVVVLGEREAELPHRTYGPILVNASNTAAISVPRQALAEYGPSRVRLPGRDQPRRRDPRMFVYFCCWG
jgi:hypothetical protein